MASLTFDREPYRSLRDYFDVYVYTAVSTCETIGVNTAFKTQFTGLMGEASGHTSSDSQLVIDRLRKVLPSLGRTDLKDMVTILVLNTTASYRNNCIMYSDGFSLGNTMRNELKSTLVHEACGHGLEASSVSKNLSVFSGKKGQKVASDIVNAFDDGSTGKSSGRILQSLCTGYAAGHSAVSQGFGEHIHVSRAAAGYHTGRVN